MNGEIINVGTEILLGNILNTHSKYLSERLANIGIGIYYHTTVGDNGERLKDILKSAIQRSDFIIITGGLGPTSDDITKEIVSEVMNKKLILDKDSLHKIETFFKSNNINMTKNNIKQAYIPEGSKILENDFGTAPGILLEEYGKIIALLPGPPRELKHMFEEKLFPILNKKSNCIIKSKVLKTISLGESKVATILKDIIDNQSNPTIATYAKEGQVEIRVTAKASSDEEVNGLIKNTEKKINDLIEGHIYGYDNESLEQKTFQLLLEKELRIGFCESCTGGLIASRFTAIPGASEVFDRGIVTYSNEAKMDELSVKSSTLTNYGAVSKETALEMSQGLLKKSNVDIALSVTGIAGPDGGSNEKPVGLVYIGISTKRESFFIEKKLFGSRTSIQNKTANLAYYELIKYLKNL